MKLSGASYSNEPTFTLCCVCPPASSTTQGVKADVLFFDRKPAAEKPWTDKLWIYDLRTNKHFTLKENSLKRSNLHDFVACYNPKNRHERKPADRLRSFTYQELTSAIN